MSSSPIPSVPLDYEPDSVYIVFVSRGPVFAGVFHHNSGNKGMLAYADVGMEGRRPLCPVLSFKLKKRIETKFHILAAHKVANLHYHEWLPNITFAPSVLVNEDIWMMSVFFRLNTIWEQGRLSWASFSGTESERYKEFAREIVPSLLTLTESFRLRQVDIGKLRAGTLRWIDTE